MKAKKTIATIGLLAGMILCVTGCTYSHNKGWSGMTEKERETAREELCIIRNDMEDEFEEGSLEIKISNIILNRVEKALDGNY